MPVIQSRVHSREFGIGNCYSLGYGIRKHGDIVNYDNAHRRVWFLEAFIDPGVHCGYRGGPFGDAIVLNGVHFVNAIPVAEVDKVLYRLLDKQNLWPIIESSTSARMIENDVKYM